MTAMSSTSTTRRILSMHPPHRRIGVPATGTAFHPYCPIDHAREETIRVLLVSDPADPGASAAGAAIEPILRRRRDFDCHRTDFDAVAGIGNGLTNVDCMVVFYRGLHVVGWGTDFDLKAIIEDAGIENAPNEPDDPTAEWKISVLAPRHPVVDGVGSFTAGAVPRRFAAVPGDAVCLLLGGASEAEFPIAWGRERLGRVFHTLLGAKDDFLRPDFVRLALNAIEWAGG